MSMTMDALTLDQFLVFVTIVAEGSFAAAARRMNRAQSAITYSIQRLEEQSGFPLFDRSPYRPVLTEAGKALLPRARRILDDVADWRHQAQGISKGLEAELTLAVVSYAPAILLSSVLGEFTQAFPFVEIRILTETFDAAAKTLRDGIADLGLLAERHPDEFERRVCGRIDLVPVAAPTHPLGKINGTFSATILRDYTQLVISPAAEVDSGRDYGVHAANRWRVNDLQTKYDLILASVGWGSMPRSRVEGDIAAGRLIELRPESWEGSDLMPSFPLVIACRKEKALGPAGMWLIEKFVSNKEQAI
ncbi:LysR family transcriptional regulator [Mesorhizobium huakuii]|uniref:LysR family transcriptional regulator n=1 Tax=Mesorhizobium huakuii TaxID=28104 RepID=A0A7G6T507_9HYPH|nr:LysR family transcriptional regulator [Mesorhizobium huakuii]QND61839.1 LysR family transcriptional regulator [Mesorhizobium huakuii]QND69069.1 LysR family transcriptional regulator [Mesorhizobium loti]